MAAASRHNWQNCPNCCRKEKKLIFRIKLVWRKNFFQTLLEFCCEKKNIKKGVQVCKGLNPVLSLPKFPKFFFRKFARSFFVVSGWNLWLSDSIMIKYLNLFKLSHFFQNFKPFVPLYDSGRAKYLIQ